MTLVSDPAGPNIARLASLIADPVRARIMLLLMDGRALTAGELAQAGGVSPQTASSHLARLIDGGLLAVASQGRHRYYRISDHDSAHLIETLSVLTDQPHAPDRAVATGPRDPDLRTARICYDHLAGAMGVRLLDGLLKTGALDGDEANLRLTERGEGTVSALGIDLRALRTARRPVCRSCLDWSERRAHLAGGLGAALLATFLDRGWIRHGEERRVLVFTAEGMRRFDDLVRH